MTGASFHNVERVKNLAGIDLLAMAPPFLELLDKSIEEVVPQLIAESEGMRVCLNYHTSTMSLELDVHSTEMHVMSTSRQKHCANLPKTQKVEAATVLM